MKQAICLLLLASCTFTLFAQTPKRKVLFIGLDGCKSEVLQSLCASNETPNINGLLAHSIYSWDALMWKDNTWSANGWSTLLTGVWPIKHNGYTNSFTDASTNFEQYPTFLGRIEQINNTLKTAAVSNWPPIRGVIFNEDIGGIDYYPVDPNPGAYNDAAMRDLAVAHLTNQNPDAFFVYFAKIDLQGHNCCFDSNNTAYKNAIKQTDTYIGDILSAVRNRPTYANEDWLVIIAPDHGGTGSSHGGSSLAERKIFVIAHNEKLSRQEIKADAVSTTIPTSFAPDGSSVYARVTGTPSTFNFGTSQDFLVELRVRTSATANDPALITNKNWQNGLNKGFVIAKQNNSNAWKVNIGDGTNRVDLNGSVIADNQWHHIAMTADRDGQLKIYQDGEFVTQTTMSQIGDINTTLPLVLGQDGTTTYPYFFNGKLSEVRIWNRVLTAQEIYAWKQRNLDNTHPAYGNLIGYWPLSEGSGTTLNDGSSLNNDFTILRSATVNPLEPATAPVFSKSSATYAKVSNASAFNFGTSQNFTIELRVKTDGTSNGSVADPPFLTNSSKVVNWQVHHPAACYCNLV